MLSCQFFYGAEGLATLRPIWEKLPGRFFTQWAYWNALLHTFDSPEHFVFVLVPEVTVIPLRRERQNMRGVPVRALRLPQYLHPPLTGVGAPVQLAALAKTLERELPGWDVIDLDHLYTENVISHGIVEPQTTCDQIRGDLPWTQFAQTLSTKMRINQNNSRNRLAKIGATFGIAETADELIPAFEQLLALEDAGWKGSEGTSIKKEAHSEDFYRRLLGHFSSCSRAYISWIKVDGRYIAMLFCLTGGDTVYALKIAYDETMKRYSPGNALIAEMIRTQRFRWINLVGNPSWGKPWNPHRTPVVRVILTNSTVRGVASKLVLRAVDMARPVVRKLRQRTA